MAILVVFLIVILKFVKLNILALRKFGDFMHLIKISLRVNLKIAILSPKINTEFFIRVIYQIVLLEILGF